MQAFNRKHCSSCCSSKTNRHSQLRITAQATPNSNGYVPPSPSSLDRPSGGGSRSFDLPRSSDIVYSNWGSRSDILRPSGGAARGIVFSTASEGSSIERPGGRGGRSDMPMGSDLPAPQDPALARPGGRAGRDLGLDSGSGSGSAPQDPALGRPGGRGGRDLDLSGNDAPVVPISLDRPGGRGGREAAAGGGDGGDSNLGGGGGSGGSGGGDSNSGSSDDSGFSFGSVIGGMALYCGVIAAAWAGNQKFFAKPEEPKKACCGCSKGKEEKAAAPAKGKKKK